MKEDKKELILDAVSQMILEQGIAGISMSKIAKRAGISVATTYLYFENKDDMLRQLYLGCKQKMNQHMLMNIPKNGTSEEKAAAFMHSFYSFSIEHKIEMNVIQQYRSSPMLELLGLEQHKLVEEFSKPWIDIFVEGAADGTFRQIDPIKMCYFCYFTAIGYITSAGEKEYESHRLEFNDIIKMTLHSIKN